MIKISGKKYDIKTKSDAKDAWTFEKRPGGWVIGTNGKKRVRFYYAKIKNKFFLKSLKPDGTDFFGDFIQASRGGSSGSGASDYTAQFPGRVRKILVKEGDKVAAGTPLVMVEAMKMEFAVKAASDGIVKKFHTSEGAQLTPGQKLLDFEESKA